MRNWELIQQILRLIEEAAGFYVDLGDLVEWLHDERDEEEGNREFAMEVEHYLRLLRQAGYIEIAERSDGREVSLTWDGYELSALLFNVDVAELEARASRKNLVPTVEMMEQIVAQRVVAMIWGA